MKKVFLLLSTIAFLSSCVDNNFEDLAPKSNCDSTKVQSFANDILPILKQKQCISCHYLPATSQFKFVVLENYDEVKKVVASGQLHKVINHLSGVTPMPYQMGKIDKCSIAKIDKWINDGSPNN